MAAKFLLQPPIDSPEEREVRDEALFGKPVFPVLRNEDIDEIQLLDFIGGDSRFFFAALKIKINFLQSPAVTWSDSTEYRDGKIKVDSLKVVNDAAERGV